MREEAIMSIVAISIMGGTIAFGMLLMTIRSIVRTNVLASLKKRCIAAGMSTDEIERVVMVGEKKCLTSSASKFAADDDLPIEKAPPVVARNVYASTH